MQYSDGSPDLYWLTKISNEMRQQQARKTSGPTFLQSAGWLRKPGWQFELAVSRPDVDAPVRWVFVAYMAPASGGWVVTDWEYREAVVLAPAMATG